MTCEERDLHRRLFYLYLAFVVYGSLVPLRFVPRPLDEAVAAFRAVPFLQLGIDSRADWVANLLLFIPLTFLAAQWLLAEKSPLARAGAGILLALAAIALAAGIEFLQLFFPQRTVSQNDIYAESLGGMLGLAAQALFGRGLRAWLLGLWHRESRQEATLRLLHAYLFVLFGFSVFPLDLTLSPVEIFHKWHAGRVVLIPFSGQHGSIWDTIYELATDILAWIPVGILWAQAGTRKAIAVAGKGLLAALVIEFFQLFVYSRVSDVTDVLLGGLGAAIGSVCARRMQKIQLSEISATTWIGAWWLWFFAILGVFWFPFHFRAASWPAAWEAFTRLPFTTYYFTSEFHALNELLRKLGFFLPGGLFLGLALAAGRKAVGRAWLALLPGTAVLVEAGQLFLPGKVADITDAMLETGGGFLGYTIARWLCAAAPASPGPARPAIPDTVPAAGKPPLAILPARFAHILAVLCLAAFIAVATRMPSLPYNVRELNEPGIPGGMVSALGLALSAYWLLNAPFALLASRRPLLFYAFPALLPAQAVVTWTLLRLSVPMESIYDIVGDPIWDWPGEWEMILRFCALHSSLAIQVVGAVLCVRLFFMPAGLAHFLYWGIASAVLAWPLHTMVVSLAATDNLTELMRNGGSFSASAALASGFFLTCVAGSSLAAASFAATERRWLVATGLVAACLASLLYWLGAEPIIVKYGQVFSAFQFLLSADREHYATGIDLAWRYFVALTAAIGAIGVLQMPAWRNWLAAGRSPCPGHWIRMGHISSPTIRPPL